MGGFVYEARRLPGSCDHLSAETLTCGFCVFAFRSPLCNAICFFLLNSNTVAREVLALQIRGSRKDSTYSLSVDHHSKVINLQNVMLFCHKLCLLLLLSYFIDLTSLVRRSQHCSICLCWPFLQASSLDAKDELACVTTEHQNTLKEVS